MRLENKDLNFIQILNEKLTRKDSVLDLAYERMGDAGIEIYPMFKNWI